MPDERTFVIIGASLAGAKAAETLRSEGFTGRIVLVGEETERPYERPPLSKGYLLGKDEREKAFVHEASWYADNGVELMLAARATNLDTATRTVTLDGYEPLRYDKLLLATGSRVRRLDVPGGELTGVRYLRTFEETAAAAREHGATVTVVEIDQLPLRRVLGDEVAQIFADLHRAHGVDFRFGTGVRELRGDGGHLTTVVLDDGTEVPADLAIIGVGIRPATELAEVAGLAVDNGVVTDAGLRTSDPHIYACGDVANSENPLLGRRVRVEHWANALNGGKAAARALLGQEVVYDRVPFFFTDQYDLGAEYSGYAEPGGYDRVVFRGDPSIVDGKAPEVIAFWVRDARVLAGMNINVWDVTDQIQALVRAGYAGRAVDLDRLADPAVPLGDLVG